MKIAIVNQPTGNRGDEAAHRALIKTLLSQLKSATIDIIFLNEPQHKIDELMVHDSRVRYINIPNPKNSEILTYIKMILFFKSAFFANFHYTCRKYTQIISSYDYVICAPGGICMGGYMYWPHLFTLYIAMKKKKTIFYWGRSIGPFSDSDKGHRLFKRTSYTLLRYFKYISLRDDVSYDLAQNIGVDSDKMVDTAFLYDPNAQIPIEISNLVKDNLYIVYVPNELTWHYDFSKYAPEIIDEFYINLMCRIRELYSEYTIVLLPQTYDSRINDYEYFVKLKTNACMEDVLIIDEHQNSDIQQAIIKHASFVIGARYHSIIFAINQGTPFLALSYEHKISGMLSILGLSDRCIDLKTIFSSDKSRVIEDIIELINRIMVQDTSIAVAKETAQKLVSVPFGNMLSLISE